MMREKIRTPIALQESVFFFLHLFQKALLIILIYLTFRYLV